MKERSILKNKYYLYLTEFFSGVSVMAVELGASRLLAPYFSSSQIVWTIIIGTIMIALALGNLWGGRTADRNPDPDRLYRRLLLAAVWIAAIPVLGKYIILGISSLLVHHPGGGHGGDFLAVFRDSAGHWAGLFLQCENLLENLPGGGDSLCALHPVGRPGRICLLGKGPYL